MTIIELFDKSPIENMVSCMTMDPDRVIFVGDGKQMEKQEEIFRNFAQQMELRSEILFRSVNRNKLDDIVALLTELICAEENGTCSVDLTGGEDLMLVAVGIVRARLKEQGISFHLHRFNINRGNVTDCDENGKTIQIDMPQLTVEQNVTLYGGAVVYDTDKPQGTHIWPFEEEEFQNQVEAIWEVARKHPIFWNGQLRLLRTMRAYPGVCPAFPDPNRVEMDVRKAEMITRNNQLNLPGVFLDLARAGLIQDLICNARVLSFRFANDNVRRIMEKEGTILELKATLLFSQMPKEKPGKKSKKKPTLQASEPMFNSVMTGVFLDWDGVIHPAPEAEEPSLQPQEGEEELELSFPEEDMDTENEIDLVMMKGLVPVFVSCKNGRRVSKNELYKLKAVAERFGGPYSRMIILTTVYACPQHHPLVESERAFLQRAEDMGIDVFPGFHRPQVTAEEFYKFVRELNI